MMRVTRGFSLVELLVVIGIITVLIAILVPTLSKAREAARRTSCASNLRQLGQAFKIYAQDNGELPRGNYHNGLGAPAGVPEPKAFSGALCDNPFPPPTGGTYATNNMGSNGTYPARNDVTAGLFLLIRVQKVPPELFICPSANGEPDDLQGEIALKRSNFTSRSNLSYSVALQYPWTFNNSGWGYYYGADMRQDLPLMADLNPGSNGTPKVYELTLASPEADMRQGNSTNHGRAGQNVLYVDGRVEFMKTPFAGAENDNIYTRTVSPTPDDRASDTAHPFGSRPPRHPADSLLLPTATATGILAYDAP